ncbi:phage portal protein [Pseudomonas sp. RGM 3321]|uniref:phage portal protein n=1 Tax=Pseudomonas sp. RGM 3321 TaxID=2930089 RepID=UPI001FCB9405|nr:phage portal protein [Pseudomonas sp. RGM 3321]MCJ2370159.1 phage portal protein [Pseudomonas sp. RGM 3321]
MNLRELEAQAKAFAPMLKGVVDRAIDAFRGSLTKDLDERDKKLRDSISESLEGLPTDVDEIAQAAAALITPPKDGKDADQEQIQRTIAEEVAKIPRPADGVSVTVDDVLPLIEEQVKTALASMPVPKDGKDADQEQIHKTIAEEVAKIPRPADGVSVTVDDVLPLIEEQVKTALASMPVPKDGKDADQEQIHRTIAEEVAKIPKPADGVSVTVDDVLPLIEQQVSAAVAAIPLPRDGESVSIEQVQVLVDKAVASALAGIDPPKDGEPGRDAAHIEIGPGIDPEKSYPRGSYAKHLGGLWRSFETTSGMRGWECIVDGVASLSVEQDGERGFKAVAQLSSGKTEEKALTLPVMIYRGVFSGAPHVPGDTVTWGGSLWHCDEATSDKPGELNSKGWRLAVKKGRDGKDGNNGKDLVKGVSIK